MADQHVNSQIAEGLFEVAQERDNAAVYREDLKFVDWVLSHNKELVNFLNSPFISYNDKCKALDDFFTDLLVPGVLVFVKMLVRDSIISSFSEIRAEYNKLSDEQANIAEGVIYTAFELDSMSIRRLERAFRRKINKNVVLRQVIDKNLLVGLKVVLDGTSYEFSVESQLDNIRENLMEKKS